MGKDDRTLAQVAESFGVSEGDNTPIPAALLAEISRQITREMASSYIYVAMSSAMDDLGWKGMAAWFHEHAEEELKHVGRFIRYLLDRDYVPKYDAVPPPAGAWKAPLEAFRDAHSHELEVTGNIKALHRLATEGRDEQAAAFLNHFLEEQTEEEAVFLDALRRVELAGDNSAALLVLDQEFGGAGGPAAAGG